MRGVSLFAAACLLGGMLLASGGLSIDASPRAVSPSVHGLGVRTFDAWESARRGPTVVERHFDVTTPTATEDTAQHVALHPAPQPSTKPSTMPAPAPAEPAQQHVQRPAPEVTRLLEPAVTTQKNTACTNESCDSAGSACGNGRACGVSGGSCGSGACGGPVRRLIANGGPVRRGLGRLLGRR